MSLFDLQTEIGHAITNARTKQGIYALGVFWKKLLYADCDSCKHFCCRDGLEKPPKQGKCKTTIANPKASNQLTLSASISANKGSKNGCKDRIPAKWKPAVKRKTSQLSELGTKSSTLQTKKRTKQTQIGYKHGGKGNTHLSQKRGPKSPSRILSSDYDDDGLSDLPSPSTFLETTGPSFVRPDSPMAGLSQQQEGETKFIDPFVLSVPDYGAPMKVDTALQVAPTATVNSKRGVSPPNTHSQQEIIEIWDGSMSESTPRIFTSPETLKSSATSALVTSPPNTTRSLKGKERVLDITDEDLDQPYFNQYPLMNTLHEILSVPAANVMSTDNEGNDSPGDAVGGWEDIDRMLYEEYKDVINFY